MDFQEKYKAQNTSPLFEDGRAARSQLAGTFAMEDDHLVLEDPGYYTGKEGGEYLTELPMTVTRELLERGRQRYVISCAPCHGYDGAGNGTRQPARTIVADCGLDPAVELAPGVHRDSTEGATLRIDLGRYS